jgi:RecA-family ATPase
MSYDEWLKRCPYGKWTCADGREVIFNRMYWPILERRPGEQAKPARPGEWVESIVDDEQFWDEFDGPPRFNADALAGMNRILADWGLPPLPPAPEPTRSAKVIPFKPRTWRLLESIPPRQNPWEHPFGAAPRAEDVWDDSGDDDLDDDPELAAKIAEEIRETNERWQQPIPHSAWLAKMIRGKYGIDLPVPIMPDSYNVPCPSPRCTGTATIQVSPGDGSMADSVIDLWCRKCDLDRHGDLHYAGYEALPRIDMRRWDDEPPPQQEWVVCSRIPMGHVSLFSGEGGAGKSLIMLQMAVDVVRGADWFDAPVSRGPALVIDAEDDEKVIHKRLADIVAHHGVSFTDVRRDLHVVSLAGKDAVLATFDRKSGRMEPTPVYDTLLEMVGDIKPKVTGIAASADVFAGEEVDRSQVRQFIAMLTKVAQVAGGAVVLISHPSLSGISSGSGLSGSTAWHNSVRSRFYLKGIRAKADDDDAPDTDLRVLEFHKNNYGPVSEDITLRYQKGLFVPATASTADAAAREAEAEQVFLSVLGRFTYQRQELSPKKHAGNYAPAAIAGQPDAKKGNFRKRELEEAMQRLLDQEKIHIAEEGPTWRRRTYLAAGPRKLL